MAKNELPYPPSPEDVPEDLTLPSKKFMRQSTYLVLLIILVMIIYLGLIALCGFGLYWAIAAKAPGLIKLVVAVISAIVFLFLIKNFMNRSGKDTDKRYEADPKNEPMLFEFVEILCEEIKAPFPHRIYLTPFMEMGVEHKHSLLHLFVPGKKSMVIGLGALNGLNLSEFKAAIAHELGHHAQKSFFASYAAVAREIVESLFVGNDRFDRWLNKGRRYKNWGGYICQFLYHVVQGIKQGLLLLFRLINSLRYKMRFEQEYICDRFGVRAAGSNAMVHALKRYPFANESLNQALHDLVAAADHRVYSSDIYYHQTAAGAYLKKIKNNADYGEAPKLKTPKEGKKVQVFDADNDSEVAHGDYHPSDYDREENCKEEFISCPIDERSPWLLFEDASELREDFSYRYYREVLNLPKDIELKSPEEVQKFIDDEHTEMTYDPKYGGIYDTGRFLDPGDLEELNESIEREPWDDGRLARVEAKLYKGMDRRADDYKDVRKELDQVQKQSNYQPTGKTRRIVEELREKLGEHIEWFKGFDRRVYFVYIQMSKRLKDQAKHKELASRYAFHLPLQKIYQQAYEKRGKLDFYYFVLFRCAPELVSQSMRSEAFHEFRQARKTLKDILRDARDMDMPMLKNFTNESLEEFLLDEPLIKEMSESSVDTKWVQKMYSQLNQVVKKSGRLYYKSVGNILVTQEQVAKEFMDEVKPSTEPAKAGEDQIPESANEHAKKEVPEEDDEDDDRPAKRKRSEDDEDHERPAKRKRSEDDEDDDRPAKRKRSEDDEDHDRPANRKRSEDDEDDDRPAKKKRSSEDDEDDDRPAKRKRSEDDEDHDRPTRKKPSSEDDEGDRPAKRRRSPAED